MSKKILVLDSGIGGVSTLHEIRKRLPNVDIIYFADDDFLPYGDKSELELLFHLVSVIERFEDQIFGVVLACNTATGVAVEMLRNMFCFPIVGTEPAVVPATKDKRRALVLVTPLESKQRKFLKLSKNKNILVCALPKLAEMVDNALLRSGDIFELCKDNCVLSEVKNIERIAKSQDIEKIVLGCTHYVFLKHANLLKNFELFDGNAGVAKRAAFLFEDVGEGTIDFVFGSGDKKKSQIALRLFNGLSNL